MTNFIELLSNHILDHSNTNPLWAKTVAIATISPFLNKVKFSDFKGDIKPNMYALMIGPSGLAEKTLPLQSIVKPIFRYCDDLMLHDGKFADEYILEPEEEGQKRHKLKYFFSIPNEYSTEAMTSVLAKRKYGIIIADEFTGLLKSVKGKDYMSSMLEYISRVYDGDAAMRITKSSGYEQANDLCISLITATTAHIYDVMKPDFFVQGTGNRFLIVTYDVENSPITVREDYYDILSSDLGSDKLKETNKQFASNLVHFFKFLDSKEMVTAAPSPEVAKILREFILKMKVRSKNIYKADKRSLEYSYLDRMELQINKLVLNITGARAYCQFLDGEFEGEEKYLHLHITVDDAKEAISLMQLYEGQFTRMLEEWSSTSQRKDVPLFSVSAPLQEISNWISKNSDDGGWANRRLLIRALQIDTRQFEDVEKTYLERDVRASNGSLGGRKSIWVRVRKD